jgi:hypothetical protein
MQAHVLVATLFAGLWLAPFTTPAAAQDCPGHTTPAAAMPRCTGHDQASMPCCAAHDHAAAPATAEDVLPIPAVQATVVTFRDPVRVGDRVLMGRYVIEHDNDRMARGEPCTYIYEAGDRRLPVVMFHCTHLTRPVSSTDTVVLRRTGTYPVQELREFQFAGESASHGVPVIR